MNPAEYAQDLQTALGPEGLETLYGRRTTRHFTEEEVTEEQTRAIYDLTKMGPTAFNSQPLRIVWVPQGPARERLVSHMMPGNQPHTLTAPMTAILAADHTWFEKFDQFRPNAPQGGSAYAENEELARRVGRDNGFIQVGYFIMAVRALGLDVGPMTGFDADGLEKDLLAEEQMSPLVVVNIGHGVPPSYERGPRYSWDEATRTL